MIEDTIGYRFFNKDLLTEALTHSSVQSAERNNERLEFLGDRVLGLAIAELLFKDFPNEEEGSLAKRHTALVKQEALVEVANTIHLADHIEMAAGESKSGGRQKKALVADAVEALIGAIYLDGGFESACQFIERYWSGAIVTQEAPPEDSKSALQEWAQAQGLSLPEYKVLGRSGQDHDPQFEVEVTVENTGSAVAVAGSKRAAEKEAAQMLLAQIKEGKV